MKINNKKLALVLFVLSTTLILGSAIDAFAADPDGRGDSGDGDIEACLNRPVLPNFPPCDVDVEWDGGNITNEASYKEGQSIPVRIAITALEVNPDVQFQNVTIGWDITKTQGGIIKHTFDYITSFNSTNKADPCLGGDPNKVCDGWASDFIDIPAPTATTFFNTNGTNNSDAFQQPTRSLSFLTPDQKKFWMFSPPNTTIEILGISYVSEGDPGEFGSNTESTQLSIRYVTNSTNVIAAFGAHISSPDDWDFHAVDVNGKSFQIECVDVHRLGGCDGGQINLDASDIIAPLNAPVLTLLKNVDDSNGGSAVAGNWTLTASGSGGFPVPGDNDNIEFIVEVDTEYSLSEDGPSGYTATNGGQFSCSINGGDPFDTNTITLQVNESAVCTITNTFDNIAPTAVAGPDDSVNEATLYQLDGTGSSDPNNDPITFLWSQTGGPDVILSQHSLHHL